MKVALCQKYVAKDGSLGGLGTLYANLAASLSALGVEVVLITSTPQVKTGLGHLLEVVSLSDCQLNHRAYSQEIAKILISLKADIVESSSWKAELYDYLLLHNRNGKAVIRAELPATILELPQILYEMESLVIERADALIAISSAVAEAIRIVYSRPEDMIIENGVDTRLFSPHVEFPTDPYRVIWVGDYSKIKRLNWLLEIIQQVSQMTFDVVLPQAPKDPLFQVLRRLPNARIHHNLSQRSLAELFARASVIISTSKDESFGLSLLEAMACGTPVLVPLTLRGANDFFRSGVDGLTYTSAEEAAYILLNTDWQKMGEAAIEQARRFTWLSCADKTLKLYYSLLEAS